jgi:uncharacterized coiled-coil DUF342 family protein
VSDIVENLTQCAVDCHELLLNAAEEIEKLRKEKTDLEKQWSAILGRNVQLNTEVCDLKAEIKRLTCTNCPDKDKCNLCNFAEKYGGYDE